MIEQNHQNLEAVLESRATLVEDYFRLTRQQVSYLSQDDMIVRATKSFTQAYETLTRDIERPTGAESEVHAELLAFYAEELRGQADVQDQDRNEGLLQSKLPRSDVGQLAQWSTWSRTQMKLTQETNYSARPTNQSTKMSIATTIQNSITF